MNIKLPLFLVFSLTLIGAAIQPASASVLSPEPQCTAQISIDKKEKGYLSGRLTNIKHTQLLSAPYCRQLKDKTIKITGVGRHAGGILETVQSITLGVQQTSSMGENGAVSGTHWEIIEMISNGTNVPKNELPWVKIKLTQP